MAIDFQQVREQVKTLGEKAVERLSRLKELRERSLELLHNHAGNLEGLRERAHEIARLHDPNLRCAIPCAAEIGRSEPLDGCYPLPDLPSAGHDPGGGRIADHARPARAGQFLPDQRRSDPGAAGTARPAADERAEPADITTNSFTRSAAR